MAGNNSSTAGSKFTLPSAFAKAYKRTSPANRATEGRTIRRLIASATGLRSPDLTSGLSVLFPGPDMGFDVRADPKAFNIHKDPLAFFAPGGSMVVWATTVTDFHRPNAVRMSSITLEVAVRNLTDELLQVVAGEVDSASGEVFRLHADLCGEVRPPQAWQFVRDLDPHGAIFLDQRVEWVSAEDWGTALFRVCAALVNILKLHDAPMIPALDIARVCRVDHAVEGNHVSHRLTDHAISGLVGLSGVARYAYAELEDDGNIWGREAEIRLLEAYHEAG